MPVTMEFVSTAVVVAIVAALGLVGIGVVISQLLKMRDYLKNSPPLPPPIDRPVAPDDEVQ